MSGVNASEVLGGCLENERNNSANGNIQSLTSPPDWEGEENAEARYERLGRERPVKFKSAWAEICFCFSVVMSQILAVGLLYSLYCTLLIVPQGVLRFRLHHRIADDCERT